MKIKNVNKWIDSFIIYLILYLYTQKVLSFLFHVCSFPFSFFMFVSFLPKFRGISEYIFHIM